MKLKYYFIKKHQLKQFIFITLIPRIQFFVNFHFFMHKVLRGVKAFRQNSLQKKKLKTLITLDRVK